MVTTRRPALFQGETKVTDWNGSEVFRVDRQGLAFPSVASLRDTRGGALVVVRRTLAWRGGYELQGAGKVLATVRPVGGFLAKPAYEARLADGTVLTAPADYAAGRLPVRRPDGRQFCLIERKQPGTFPPCFSVEAEPPESVLAVSIAICLTTMIDRAIRSQAVHMLMQGLR